MLKTDRVFAFPFVDKKTKTPAYWKDVGSIEAYYGASVDLLAAKPWIWKVIALPVRLLI